MKYIDAEKLIAEIERLRDIAQGYLCGSEKQSELSPSQYRMKGIDTICSYLLSLITSLQQEQLVGEEYNIEICKEIHTLRVGSQSDIKRLIAQDKQERPEVDLEKEFYRWLSKEIEEWGGEIPPYGEYGLFDIAHHFYELGLNARKEK